MISPDPLPHQRPASNMALARLVANLPHNPIGYLETWHDLMVWSLRSSTKVAQSDLERPQEACPRPVGA